MVTGQVRRSEEMQGTGQDLMKARWWSSSRWPCGDLDAPSSGGKRTEALEAGAGFGRRERCGRRGNWFVPGGEKETPFSSLVMLKRGGGFRTKNGEALARHVESFEPDWR
jgi:hypothetical protein